MKVLVLNGSAYKRALDGLYDEAVFSPQEFYKDPQSFDLVLFTGGADISPYLYDDSSPKHFCYVNEERDHEEINVFDVALKYSIPMTGICRGMQFLNVMTGGRMIHHLDNHEASLHSIITLSGEKILVNSFHHQMCIPAPESLLLAWSKNQLSDCYIGKNDEIEKYEGPEIEALIFPNINAVAVQYHPEWMGVKDRGYTWYQELVRNLLNMKMSDFLDHYRGNSCSLITSTE